MSPGLAAFKLAFQISPIYLTGGSAGSLAGGTLPLVSLTQGNVFTSLLSGGDDLDLDSYFAHFMPLPGTSLVNQKVGMYPFANQATAANAVIADPTRVSLMMICPAKEPGDYLLKQTILTGLKATLDQHNANGGTYSVNTPAFLFTDCLLLNLEDVTPGESKQVEYRWKWDFVKPLISLADASNAQSNLMGKISSGTQVTPNANGEISATGIGNTIGDPSSGASPPLIPSSQSNQGLGSTGGANQPRGTSLTFADPNTPAGPPTSNNIDFGTGSVF